MFLLEFYVIKSTMLSVIASISTIIKITQYFGKFAMKQLSSTEFGVFNFVNLIVLL